MNKIFKAISLSFFLFFSCGTDVNAKKVRALFLGNSYTQVNNLPELIKQLALSTGDTLEYSSNTPGGYSFQGHSTNAVSLSLIATGNWDYVILQEQSQKPSFPDGQVAAEVYPYAKILDSLIHVSNPCATTLFYVTWGRKNGDAANCAGFPPLCTYEGMDSLLQLRYTIMAEDNNAAIAPVAMVWRQIRNSFPAIELYEPDNSHPSNNGSYAAACAFYAILFQKDPNLCSYNYTVSASNAATIKTIAGQIAYDSLHHWNRFVTSPLANFNYTISNSTVTFNNLSENADSYLWDFGDNHTDTAENPIHTYATPGTYNVTLKVQKNGCEHSIVITLTLNPTGIDEQIFDKEIAVYPNPATDYLTIQLAKPDSYTIVLKDIVGNRVLAPIFFQEQHYKLNIAALPAGNYLLQIQNRSRQSVTKEIMKIAIHK